MLELLLEPFNYPFMIYGLQQPVWWVLSARSSAHLLCCAAWPFFGDALSHTILPGIAVGYLIGGSAREPLFWWALGTAIISALSIGAISRGTKIKEDTAIGIIFAGMFALGHRAHLYRAELCAGSVALPVWGCAGCHARRSGADGHL
jgi:manganese/iron transport system permease protein